MSETSNALSAGAGFGPLFERDYTGTIVDASCSPEDVVRMLRERFADFAPAETAAFDRPDGREGLLEVGDELNIHIALVGRCKVRVVHVDDCSMTLRTLCGHPEAGRITFGADRDERGRLVFHIRSRARASGIIPYLGFLMLGKQMQGRCWIRFVRRVAEECGGRIEGGIHVRSRRVVDDPSDRAGCDRPTFTRSGLG